MYKEFYQLKENPFNVTSDPAFFFASKRHSEAFASLQYGIQERKGIIVITGEIGTGKTTLCRTLLNRLDNRTKTAFILNPNFSELQLLQLIVKDLAINNKAKNKAALVNVINEFLLSETSHGNNVAVIIDEAQNLRPTQLEQVRLLSNLETEKEKLLQIVLVGQPELSEKLKLTNLRQINQRVSVKYHILPLDKGELKDYIEHRLRIAGASKKLHFTEKAMDKIYEHSGGTPRLINIICDRALLAGFVAEVFTIDEEMVRLCIEEIM